VDLVMKTALKPRICKNILTEVLYVWRPSIFWYVRRRQTPIFKSG
jgi:hypothetical protein